MITCRSLIIDDEILAREVIRTFLKNDQTMVVLDEAANGTDAVIKILKHRPDLIFLDIQMPGFDGFEVIKEIWPHHQPCVIFTTAFDQYALQAFEVNAIDYLLKPFDEIRFHQALDRIKQKLHAKPHPGIEMLANLRGAESAKSYLKRMLVKDSGKLLLIKTEEITHFDADGNYITLHTAARSHTIYESLSSLEARLDPMDFMRVSRSFIININCISELEPYFNGEYIIHLNTGQKVKCSRGYRDNMRNFLSSMN
jgi:two-component system LytT family response regulator